MGILNNLFKQKITLDEELEYVTMLYNNNKLQSVYTVDKKFICRGREFYVLKPDHFMPPQTSISHLNLLFILDYKTNVIYIAQYNDDGEAVLRIKGLDGFPKVYKFSLMDFGDTDSTLMSAQFTLNIKLHTLEET